jgi:hypothetical protein
MRMELMRHEFCEEETNNIWSNRSRMDTKPHPQLGTSHDIRHGMGRKSCGVSMNAKNDISSGRMFSEKKEKN